MRVLVTRPQAQAAEWVARLQALGVAAAAVPLLGIDGPADVHAVRRAWAGLAQHRAVMFVSPNAVERFFAAATDSGAPAWPAGVLAAGTGPGTQAALLQAGVPPAQVLCPAPDSPTGAVAAGDRDVVAPGSCAAEQRSVTWPAVGESRPTHLHGIDPSRSRAGFTKHPSTRNCTRFRETTSEAAGAAPSELGLPRVP